MPQKTQLFNSLHLSESNMTKVKKYKGKIPNLTTDQMIEVDRLMMEDYHIELIQMMENAGRCLAILANQVFIKKNITKKTIIVLAGTGGNGGGAMVCARRLHSWGAKVKVFITAAADKMTPIPAHQLGILKRIGIPVLNGANIATEESPDLIIDGVIGYSIKGDPYGVPKDMIDWANNQKAPVLALDTPSGLGLTTGKVHNPTVKATATMTLALPKQGLFEKEAAKVIGDLYLGDISVPPSLYAEDSLKMDVSKTLFAESDIILVNEKSEPKKKKKAKKSNKSKKSKKSKNNNKSKKKKK